MAAAFMDYWYQCNYVEDEMSQRRKDPLSQFYCTENVDCFVAFPEENYFSSLLSRFFFHIFIKCQGRHFSSEGMNVTCRDCTKNKTGSGNESCV